MSAIIERMVNEAAAEATEQAYRDKTIEVATKLLTMGVITPEQIAEVCGLSLEEVQTLAKQTQTPA